MSNRQLEEAQEQKLHEHVARELGISVETLDEYTYETDEANYGIVWRITWKDTVPPGVEAHGAVGTQWTDIHPLYEPDDPEG
jgi:hypothetical protein